MKMIEWNGYSDYRAHLDIFILYHFMIDLHARPCTPKQRVGLLLLSLTLFFQSAPIGMGVCNPLLRDALLNQKRIGLLFFFLVKKRRNFFFFRWVSLGCILIKGGTPIEFEHRWGKYIKLSRSNDHSPWFCVLKVKRVHSCKFLVLKSKVNNGWNSVKFKSMPFQEGPVYEP